MLQILACLLSVAWCSDLGDRLMQAYTVYSPLPVTSSDAHTAGWKPTGTGACDPHTGIQYAKDGKLSTKNPLALYFTPAGQIAGVGTMIYGDLKSQLIDAGYFQKMASQQYFLSVTFRSKSEVCSSTTSSAPLGDQLVINANTIAHALPTTERDAIAEGKWHKGSCFAGMGYHYFNDLVSGSNMSWTAANLMPVVPMFNNDGLIQSIFFTSTIRQQTIFPPSTNGWEPVPLATSLMCGNWCDKDCTFRDMGTFDVFSTMHLYFRDTAEATCANNCKLSCCP